ncbi:MAG: class I SAM-dependent methyltransferase, partial [Methanobacteriota archaeon]
MIRRSIKYSGRLAGFEIAGLPPAGRIMDGSGFSAFGEFQASGGRKIQLLAGYRDTIKNWRQDYWPTIALLSAQARRLRLPPEASRFLHEIRDAPTLTRPLDEVADLVASVHDLHPDQFVRSDIRSPLTKRPVIAPALTGAEVASAADAYRGLVRDMLWEIRRNLRDRRLEDLSVLETGCGMGYGVVAFASAGCRRSVGIDLAPPDFRALSERPAVLERLGYGKADVARRTEIRVGDIVKMPFDDEEFDFVHSHSVLEHIHDLP